MNQIELDVPTLILIAGIGGSGKTTLSRELVKHIKDAYYMDKDIINDAFLLTSNESDKGIKIYALSGPQLPRDEHYNRYVRLQSYRLMLELAKVNLEAGKHPILDGNYTKDIRQGYLNEIVEPFFDGVSYRRKLVFCYAREDTIKERLRQRKLLQRDFDKLKSEEAWRRFLDEQPILPPELTRHYHIKVDTEQSLESNIRNVLAYISTRDE